MIQAAGGSFAPRAGRADGRRVAAGELTPMVTQAKSNKKTADAVEEGIDLGAPRLYINRELALLEYQQRLLAQACDTRHPLLERIRFIKIVSDNLDEFFMVRVSDLQDEVRSGMNGVPPDGMTATQQLTALRK